MEYTSYLFYLQPSHDLPKVISSDLKSPFEFVSMLIVYILGPLLEANGQYVKRTIETPVQTMEKSKTQHSCVCCIAILLYTFWISSAPDLNQQWEIQKLWRGRGCIHMAEKSNQVNYEWKILSTSLHKTTKCISMLEICLLIYPPTT